MRLGTACDAMNERLVGDMGVDRLGFRLVGCVDRFLFYLFGLYCCF